jgi:hypothetical protein
MRMAISTGLICKPVALDAFAKWPRFSQNAPKLEVYGMLDPNLRDIMIIKHSIGYA